MSQKNKDISTSLFINFVSGEERLKLRKERQQLMEENKRLMEELHHTITVTFTLLAELTSTRKPFRRNEGQEEGL